MVSFRSCVQLLDFELLCALHILHDLSLYLIVWRQHRCEFDDLSLLCNKPFLCVTDFYWVLLEHFTKLDIDKHLFIFVGGPIRNMLNSFLFHLLLFFLLRFLLDILDLLFHLLLVFAENSDALRLT